MEKNRLVAILFGLLCSLTLSAQKFVIEGNVASCSEPWIKDGSEVVLSSKIASNLDTIRTYVKDGKFRIEGHVDYPVPARLLVGEAFRYFYLDNGEYHFEYEAHKESGSPYLMKSTNIVKAPSLEESLSHIFQVNGMEGSPITRWYFEGTMDQHQDSVKIIYDKCNAILLHACDTISNKQALPFLLMDMRPFTYENIWPHYSAMPKKVQQSYMGRELYRKLLDERQGKLKDEVEVVWNNWEGSCSDGSKMRVEPF